MSSSWRQRVDVISAVHWHHGMGDQAQLELEELMTQILKTWKLRNFNYNIMYIL